MNDTAKPARPRETAELIERVLKRAKIDRECAENSKVVADLLEPQMVKFNAREGQHNIYAVRLAVDHGNSVKKDGQYADDLEAIATRLTELEAERDRLLSMDHVAAFISERARAEAAEEAGRQKATAEIVAWLDDQAAWHDKHDDGLSGFDRIAQGYREAASGIRDGDHLPTGE